MELLQSTVNVLLRQGISFEIEEEEKGCLLLLADGTKIRLRPSSLEITKEMLRSPSEKQKSIAFWYEKQRVAEATFFLIDKDEDEENSEEVLRLALRIPIPPGSKVPYRVRSWEPFLLEALQQINEGEKKLHDGSWGDLKPQTEKE